MMHTKVKGEERKCECGKMFVVPEGLTHIRFKHCSVACWYKRYDK